jgi:hypothetical protein
MFCEILAMVEVQLICLISNLRPAIPRFAPICKELRGHLCAECVHLQKHVLKASARDSLPAGSSSIHCQILEAYDDVLWLGFHVVPLNG